MQAWRDRMLAVPSVKQQYEAKLTEDPSLATDEGKRRQFFRDVMRELSPFLQPSSKEALAGLILALQGGKPAAAPEAEATPQPAPAPTPQPAVPQPAAP
jgi:hypothetical protein